MPATKRRGKRESRTHSSWPSPTGSTAPSSTRVAERAKSPSSLQRGDMKSLASTSSRRRSSARSKAAARTLKIEFQIKDALTLHEWDRRFATVTDFGLFHVFSDADRQRYVDGLRTVLVPDGRLFLACFSDEELGTEGPRRVSQQELRDAFADGFAIESIEPSQFEVNPRLSGTSFSPGGPKAWVRDHSAKQRTEAIEHQTSSPQSE
jgi:SAM-dependent methyltransferase